MRLISLSQYPDFLNMTGASINEYENLVTIQESMDPQPNHARYRSGIVSPV